MSDDTGQEDLEYLEFHRINGQLLPMTKVYTLLDALATHELDPGETDSMRQHLTECQACSQRFVEIGQYHHLLHGVMSNDAPVPLIEHLAEQHHTRPLPQLEAPALVPSPPHRQPSVFRRASTRLLIAAVVLVVIVADLLIFRNVLPQPQHSKSAHGAPTATLSTNPSDMPTASETTTPTEKLPPNSPWRQLWTLPALPALPPAAYADPPYLPQVAWSPANPQRLYLCRAAFNYVMPAVLHNLYRSDDQGLHWMVSALPEAAARCHVEVDPTNADALILQDNQNHSFVSRDGGQHWQPVPDPPQWNTSLGSAPDVQIMAGRLYVEGYWTADLTHWTRWYPVAGEQQHVYVQINPQSPQTLYTAVALNEFRCEGTPSTLRQLGIDPINSQAELCRSDDGGQTWHFLAVVVVENASHDPAFCLALNHPETLYAWGYSAQSYPTLSSNGAMGDPIHSTDGGTTWTRLAGVFVGGDSGSANFHPCSADTYAGQGSIKVDWDDAVEENNQWQNFALTADGTIYHVVDTTATRQSVTMTVGVSLLIGENWKVIAPYPDGLTTPDTNYRLRMLLITPPSGSSVLLAFTDQHVYGYALSSV